MRMHKEILAVLATDVGITLAITIYNRYTRTKELNMKAALTLVLTVGFLTSTSHAFCLKQFAKQQNRYSASVVKTNYQPGMKTKSNVHTNNTQAGITRK